MVFLLFILAWAQAVQAAHFRLFDGPGQQVDAYNEHMKFLQSEDTLEFSNGVVFPVLGLLGRGFTTIVVDIGGDKVLRIPKHKRIPFVNPYSMVLHDSSVDGGRTYDVDYTYYTVATLQGYPMLRNAGVPVVEVFTEESLPGEYVVAHKVRVMFNLDRLLSRRFDIDPRVLKRAEDGLVHFARRSAAFTRIGDFKADQLVFTGTDWVLLDWTSKSTLAKHTNDSHLFELWGRLLGYPLYPRIVRAIDDGRRAAGLHWSARLFWDQCRKWLM